MNLTFEPEMYNVVEKTAQKGTSTKKETKIKKLTRKEINAMDTTDYLLSNPANKKFLLDAIEKGKDPKNWVTISLEDYK
ncbi:MAG: hypothetical protein Ta2D_05350 [Rickettsiales bacterium]|nr:MAG: hypothetical protein Ta2D_05350 [Rickettsiales bacterium]